MQSRPATDQEIFEATGTRRALYRHFVRETYNPRAEHGVSHRQYSRSKLRDIEGRAFVMYQGELHHVVGTLYTLSSGRTFVANIRLDSPYLPEVY